MSGAMPADIVMRPIRATDRADTLDLWVAAWQAAYPAIDFAARRGWMDNRIDELDRSGAQSWIALHAGRISGLLIVDPATGYLDQIVVAPQSWGFGVAGILIAEAKRLSPKRLDLHVNQDNARAIRFYQKHGFNFAGESVNAQSGRPTFLMTWRG